MSGRSVNLRPVQGRPRCVPAPAPLISPAAT